MSFVEIQILKKNLFKNEKESHEMAQTDVGQIKYNVDATIFKDQKCFSIGMCLCGNKDEYLAAKMAWFKGGP